MIKTLLISLILMLATGLCANQNAFEVQAISSELIKSIDLSQAVFLEIRAGEYSSTLENELRLQLLKLGADIREYKLRVGNGLNETSDESYDKQYTLSSYNLSRAHLIQINMDINWQLVEKKRIFSYQSSRVPVYSFEIKTIQLPEYKLLALSNYKHIGKNKLGFESGNHHLRWFDPIIATAALGSLIYLLWTTE